MRVPPGSVVILDGTESGLARGEAPLRYRWRQKSGPRVELARTELARTEVRLTAEGRYVFELSVSAAGETSGPCPVRVEVSAGAPETGPVEPKLPPVGEPGGRRADFALLSSDASELVRIFGEKTGLTLRVDPEWRRPEALSRQPLTFVARDVTPELALEMAARLLGGRYVRDRQDAAVVTSGLCWLAGGPQRAGFLPVGSKIPAGDASALLALVRETCRGPLFACPEALVEYDAARTGLQVVGPVSMHARLEALLEALGPGELPVPPRPPLTADEQHRDDVLARKLDAVLVDRPLSAAALELGGLLGTAVAWEGAAEGGPMPFVSIRCGGRPAREALDELARAAGCAGFTWVRGGGIWLYRSEPPGESAEDPWAAADVMVFPAAPLREKGVLPGAAVYAIRQQVQPASWRESSAVCAYYKHTDRLVIVAGPSARREALRLLLDLLERSGAT